jgi:hypothetical protein
MARKTRIWIGITLLSVLVLNYLVIGIPVYRKMASLDNNIKAMMVKQVKSGHVLNNSGDTYIIEVLKKEAIGIGRRMSWMIFGLVVYKKGV